MSLPESRALAQGAKAFAHAVMKRACTPDQLYLEPNAQSNIDVESPTTFKWDSSCNSEIGEKLDLYLYCPALPNSLIHKWIGVPSQPSEFTVQLLPAWWNNTANATLYTAITPTGQTAGMTFAQGPYFQVHWEPQSVYSVYTSNGVVMTSTRPGALSQTGNTVFETVSAAGTKGTSKGVIAVAVIIPVVVICILGAVAFYFYRIKEKEKLKRWSHALSQHSTLDWEKGALPGERIPSSYGGRPSSHYSRASQGRPSTGYGRPGSHYSRASQGRPSTGYGRPASSVMMENMAGAGAGGAGIYATRAFPMQNGDDQYYRNSFVGPDGQVRQSRVSFADGNRPRVSFSNDTRPHVSSNLAADAATAAAYASGSAIADDREEHVDFAAHPSDESSEYHSPMKLRAQTSVEPVEALDTPADRNDAMSPTGTVQYGPDQMLAVYAARGTVNSSPTPGQTPTPTSPTNPPPSATKTGMRRFLARKDSKTKMRSESRAESNASPEPVSMRSYVHLHTGTAPARAVDQLPAPGPPRPPSNQSQYSRYEDAEDGSRQ